MGREETARRLGRKYAFIFWAGLRPAEAAGAHHPGSRATSWWWPSGKGIMDQPRDYPQRVSPMSVYNIFFLNFPLAFLECEIYIEN